MRLLPFSESDRVSVAAALKSMKAIQQRRDLGQTTPRVGLPQGPGEGAGNHPRKARRVARTRSHAQLHPRTKKRKHGTARPCRCCTVARSFRNRGWKPLHPVQVTTRSTSLRKVDDRAYFELDDEELTPFQLSFLAALRVLQEGRLRPYCAGFGDDTLLLALDVDAPDVALVNVGLELRGNQLRGDRISVHDRSFPPTPTRYGFVLEGDPNELAARGCELLTTYARRPVVLHEWLHRRRVYAACHLFEDTGERLAQMYRGDWAPRGQKAELVAKGFVHGGGWVQTEGLGKPDRVTLVRGTR
jgi:hypothetical protein